MTLSIKLIMFLRSLSPNLLCENLDVPYFFNTKKNVFKNCTYKVVPDLYTAILKLNKNINFQTSLHILPYSTPPSFNNVSKKIDDTEKLSIIFI